MRNENSDNMTMDRNGGSNERFASGTARKQASPRRNSRFKANKGGNSRFTDKQGKAVKASSGRGTQNRNTQNRNTPGKNIQKISSGKSTTQKNPQSRALPAKSQPKPSGNRSRKGGSKLKIIPLGGLEQIGMNITAIEYEESIVVIDCGLSFPEDDMLGIDLVIPDVTYLKENIRKVKGFVITHGHEDHIGALPYVLREVNVPIYATKLTIGLITNKLNEHGLTRSTKLKEVKHGQVINLGDFAIEFIKTNHSIQDAAALAIYSPVGIVMHTGDFKVDYTPVFGDAIDLQRFAEIGKKGVLALMCDSTNAERQGFTMSERTVGRVFDNLFNENRSSRIIIATFASNVDRVQQIINTAYGYGRKVAVEGRSMVNVITTAAELGYLRIPDNTLIDIDQVKDYPDEKVVLITTGSQGESMAALSRMAANIHKKITIKPNDTIIFSSNPIPGNEKAVSKVINELSMMGAKVIFQDVHVSGHACQEEIKLIYSLVKPRYAIPVHGEYRHLTAHRHIVEELGFPKENIIIMSSGNVLELDENGAEITGSVQTGAILVDGLGVGDVGNIVLRDRQHLAEDGIMIVVMTLERHTNVVLAGPDIVSRGFVYVRESEDLMEHAREVVNQALDSCLDHRITDWGKIKTEVKDALSGYLWKKVKRSPMILPIIMEA
ncbi:MAG: ribonuclease J [Clostridiales bacterium]|nr:ribonuclease J [Clostridiales bacterium]